VSPLELTSSPSKPAVRRRTRRDPKPHFKPDVTGQLDAVRGSPSLTVPEKHLARAVQSIVARFDLSSIEGTYSSLGRHGFHPRSVLSVWIYGSLIGIHKGTVLAKSLVTDAALRFLSGGHEIKRGTLNNFRQKHGALFAELIAQTVKMARDEDLLPLEDLAADSVRVRAHASTKEVRTLSRSKKRLKELRTVDENALSHSALAEHRAKIAKHEKAVAECEKRGRTSIVRTNPSAALMKFPDGAGLPGHRVTAMAAGVKARFIVAVLVTCDVNDYGMLRPIVDETKKMLPRIGVADGTKLQVAADSGYSAKADLDFAYRVREGIDILVDGAHEPVNQRGHFGREHFQIRDDGSAICPAGRLMKGPRKHSDGHTRWQGSGCTNCSLRSRCTDGKERSLVVNIELDEVRAAMHKRMAAPGARQRYNRRIATVEPVFSNIESTMGFRRASSRREETVVAEVMLKVLAHNVSRLLAAKKLSRAFCMVTPYGALVRLPNEFLATL
jgi:transposase